MIEISLAMLPIAKRGDAPCIRRRDTSRACIQERFYDLTTPVVYSGTGGVPYIPYIR